MAKHLSRPTRIVTGVAAAAIVGTGALGTIAANASTDKPTTADRSSAPAKNAAVRNTQQTTHLTEAAALRAATAAMNAAEKGGQHVSVAVVDRDGRVIVQLRGDGSGPQSFESAQKKGWTAVAWNAPTSVLAKRFAANPSMADIPGTLFLGGGAPVTVKGAPVAGVGVAGAPSGDLDETFAKAGVAALAR